MVYSGDGWTGLYGPSGLPTTVGCLEIDEERKREGGEKKHFQETASTELLRAPDLPNNNNKKTLSQRAQRVERSSNR
jgi:hypothetical protein